VLKVWTETRRIADDDLLALHTLDTKLGKWLPSMANTINIVEADVVVPNQSVAQNNLQMSVNDAVDGPAAYSNSPSAVAEVPSSVDQHAEMLANKAVVQSEHAATNSVAPSTTASLTLGASEDSLELTDEAASHTAEPQNPQPEVADEQPTVTQTLDISAERPQARWISNG